MRRSQRLAQSQRWWHQDGAPGSERASHNPSQLPRKQNHPRKLKIIPNQLPPPRQILPKQQKHQHQTQRQRQTLQLNLILQQILQRKKIHQLLKKPCQQTTNVLLVKQFKWKQSQRKRKHPFTCMKTVSLIIHLDSVHSIVFVLTICLFIYVFINCFWLQWETKLSVPSKYQVRNLPFGIDSAEEFKKSMNTPLGKEWIPSLAHAAVTKPRIVTKPGLAITPISLSTEQESKYKEKAANYVKKYHTTTAK